MKPTMRRVIVGAILAVTAVILEPGVQAAERGEGRKGPAANAQRFRENFRRASAELNLSEEQRAKLKEIFVGQREVLEELRDDQTLTRRQKLAKLRQIRAEVLEAIREVLTDAQWDTWQKMREDHRAAVQRELEG